MMKLALFFSFGMSVELWKEKGLLDREKLIYEKLIEKGKVDKIYWFTYGSTDKQIEGELKKGIEIVHMPSIYRSRIGKLFYSLLLPIIYYRILKSVDILKTNQMYGAWTAVIAKILHRKKLVVRTGYTWTICANNRNASSLKRYITKTIEKFAYSFADGIIVSSWDSYEYLKKNYKLKGTDAIVPNYVDIDLFKSLDVKRKKNSICFVGRLAEEKNLFSLLEAVRGLKCSLTLIGSGNLKQNLEEYARVKRIEAEFLGIILNSELPEVLNQYEAFILPSLYEGMPKALLEAMACGLPCIGSNVEGIREVIKHKENGYLCETDTESIRQAILEVLEDRTLQENIGQNARRTILDNFSLEKCLEKETALYESL